MREIRIAAAAAFLVLAVSLPARAERLRICFEDWAPFSSMVGGRAEGIVVAAMDRALAAAGHAGLFAQLPYQRCLNGVRAGTYDAMLMTSDEPGLVPMRVSVAFWEVGVVTRPDWPRDSYEALSDFDGAVVGLVGAYAYHPAVQRALADWRVELTSEALFNLRKAASGRIDATVVDIPWARIQAEREGLALKVLTPILFATPQYMFLTPAKAGLVPGLDAALQGLIDDGTVDRLYEQALGTDFRTVRARAANALIKD
jgi:polar amino acid transport system substrate-binding protein